MGALLEAVRQSVTAQQAAERYGLAVDRHGKALCPWHEDRHPSLSFDRRTGRCRCFACGAGGSAVDLTAKLLDVSPLEAAQAINRDFGLGLADADSRRPAGEELARAEAHRRERARAQEEREAAGRQFSDNCRRIHELERSLSHFTPETSEGNAVFNALLRELSERQDRADAYLCCEVVR